MSRHTQGQGCTYIAGALKGDDAKLLKMYSIKNIRIVLFTISFIIMYTSIFGYRPASLEDHSVAVHVLDIGQLG